MDKDQLNFFRDLLVKNRQELLQISTANKNATETVELDQTRQGRLSRMDALQGQQMSIASVNRRKQELKNIELALTRIDNDEYGYCQLCEKEIPARRLEINPALTYCIHCAEKLESNNQNDQL